MKCSNNNNWWLIATDNLGEAKIYNRLNRLSRHLVIQRYIDIDKKGNREMYLNSDYYDINLEIWIMKVILTRIGREDLLDEIINSFSTKQK